MDREHTGMDGERAGSKGERVQPAAIPFDPVALDRKIELAAGCVWSVDALRPQQMEALRFIFSPTSPSHCFIVHRTGAGKTLVMKVAGVIEKGVVAVFIPLHALTADVMQKFSNAEQRWGTVQALLLDELQQWPPLEFATR